MPGAKLGTLRSIRGDRKGSLFRRLDAMAHQELTGQPMTRLHVWRLVKRRAKAAGLPADVCCHSFRATGIPDLLDQGVPLEDVQYLAEHSDPRTTRLYDRRRQTVTRNIVETVSI